MRSISRLALLTLLASACATTAPPPAPTAAPAPAPVVAPAKPAAPTPPIAKKEPKLRELHGEKFTDDYFWLRNKGTPEVEAYLHAEDAYADAMLAPLKGLTEQLYTEIVSHIAEDDETAPARDGRWLSWERTVKDKQYPIFLRRETTPGAKEQVVLDQNELAAGKEFLALGDHHANDDGSWWLYTTDDTGFRVFTLQFKDLRTGQLAPEKIGKVVQAVWGDNQTAFYTLQDEAKRPYQVWRHLVGTAATTDTLVYEEKDERYELWLARSASRAYLLINSESKLSTEVRLVDLKKPKSAPVVVEPRHPELKYFVDHGRDGLLILANDTGHNFRLVSATVKSPGQKAWKELRAHDEKVMLEGTQVFADHLVLVVREGGTPQLEVYDFKTKKFARVPLPEPDHNVGPEINDEFGVKTFRYTYTSLSTPPSTYELDLATLKSTLLKQQPVPGGFDRTNYLTEWIWATAKDGTKVPISLVYRKDVKLDGSAPLHLWGYGSYGFSIDSSFRPGRLPLLDRGVIYAIAHIRGGGELGKQWHEHGRLKDKANTFTDFIACAEHLIANHYTSPQRLTIEGRSAGGLLMGAVVNLRPDLFKAVLNGVPFVDVINTMNDPSLPMTVTEYEEWGNPGIAEQYGWIRGYSPYDNLAARAYPTMLVRTSYNDSQVMYWEPAKYVARMRTLKTGENLLLFKIHMDAAGHGGKSGRYEVYRDVAADEAFLLWQDGAVKLASP